MSKKKRKAAYIQMFRFGKHLDKFNKTDDITEAHQEIIQSSYEAKYVNINYTETEEIREREEKAAAQQH